MALQWEIADLARAGATRRMLLERLIELTGKAGVIQDHHGAIECLLRPVLRPLDPVELRRALHASDMAVQQWLIGKADPAMSHLLTLELPAERVVRIVAPLWVDGRNSGTVSLVGHPDDLTARDRTALTAAARAIALGQAGTLDQVHPDPAARGRRSAALAMRFHGPRRDDLVLVVRQALASPLAVVARGVDTVRVTLPYDPPTPWAWRQHLAELHAELSTDLGTVTIGHALRAAANGADQGSSLVRAAEAALVGDELFGPGQVISYAEAQLARFLHSTRDRDSLRTLYERVVGKLVADGLRRERDLISTLDTYCETVSTQGTADRLQVHRNTVLYRLKRIEEITQMDLADGATRMLFQLGLMAGSKMGNTHARSPDDHGQRSPVPDACSTNGRRYD
jgi:hypothetical protein